MTFSGLVQRFHLWAGLVLGIQIFLWMLSGVVMTWFDLDLVRGERSAFSSPEPELEARGYASPGGVIAQMDGVYSVELRYFLNRTVYEVDSLNGKALFDAESGERISPIDERMARRVAETDYVGPGELESVSLYGSPPPEYRGPRPVWRADFNDRLHTRLYISRETGRVVSRRNDVWRIYDFFWMLHIMDYDERKNFNTPLVRVASAAGLIFSISGLAMLFFKSGRRKLAADLAVIAGLVRRRQKDAQ